MIWGCEEAKPKILDRETFELPATTATLVYKDNGHRGYISVNLEKFVLAKDKDEWAIYVNLLRRENADAATLRLIRDWFTSAGVVMQSYRHEADRQLEAELVSLDDLPKRTKAYTAARKRNEFLLSQYRKLVRAQKKLEDRKDMFMARFGGALID